MASAGLDIGSLLASLGGGGAPGAPPPPDGGGGLGGIDPAALFGGGPQQAPPDQGGAQSIPDRLQQALDLIHSCFADETDAIDKDAMVKIMGSIQSLFAQEQKQKDQAMGGSNLQMMRRNR